MPAAPNGASHVQVQVPHSIRNFARLVNRLCQLQFPIRP
jgi:hypothetical protein